MLKINFSLLCKPKVINSETNHATLLLLTKVSNDSDLTVRWIASKCLLSVLHVGFGLVN